MSDIPTGSDTKDSIASYKGSVSGLRGMLANRLSDGIVSMASSVASKIDRKMEAVANQNVGTSKIPIAQIYPCPEQPRQVFDPRSLEELSQTMRELGQAQAITVRKTDEGYEIISGERRYRAAKLAGFTHLDCVVKNCSQKDARLLALVENMQREDLLPIEEAHYLRKILAENEDLTLEKLGTRLGTHKSTLSEKIKLTEVPADLHNLLHSKGRSFTHRHWRVISRIQDEAFRRQMLIQALENQLSVSELERSLKAAGVLKSSRSRKNSNILENSVSEGGLGESPYRLYSRSGSALKIHAATLVVNQLAADQKQALCEDLETLLQELRNP
ncbi:MAG: ParB/RepB/Spo0J family partition protein [Bdellovibrionota bacterium]